MGYSSDFLAVIDPTCKNKFFSMAIEKAEEWAEHRVSLPDVTYPSNCLFDAEYFYLIRLTQHDNDVYLEHTPGHFRYNLETRKHKTAPTPAIPTQSPVMNSEQVSQLVVGLAQGMGTVFGDNLRTPVGRVPIGHTTVSALDQAHGRRSSSPPFSSSPPTCQEPLAQNGIDGFLDSFNFAPGRK